MSNIFAYAKIVLWCEQNKRFKELELQNKNLFQQVKSANKSKEENETEALSGMQEVSDRAVAAQKEADRFKSDLETMERKNKVALHACRLFKSAPVLLPVVMNIEINPILCKTLVQIELDKTEKHNEIIKELKKQVKDLNKDLNQMKKDKQTREKEEEVRAKAEQLKEQERLKEVRMKSYTP